MSVLGIGPSEIQVIMGIIVLISFAAIIIMCISRVWTEAVERNWLKHDKYFKALKWQEEKCLKTQDGVMPKFNKTKTDYEISGEILKRMDV